VDSGAPIPPAWTADEDGDHYLNRVVGLSLKREQKESPEQPISQASSVSSRQRLSSLSVLEARQVASSCCQADQSVWKARQQRFWQVRREAREQQASFPTLRGSRWGLAGADFRRQPHKPECGATGPQPSSRASSTSWIEPRAWRARLQVSRQPGLGACSQQCRSASHVTFR
jgi:hypothetical protein